MEKETGSSYGPRRASGTDIQVGINLRKMRLLAKLSQQDISAVLGVTFQQVQKYENGSNRLPLAMLVKLKSLYGVSWERFFAGLPESAPSPAHVPHEFDDETIKLCRRIAAIRDSGLRRKIRKIIEVLDSAA